MDIKLARDMAIESMQFHGLLDKGWSFQFNNSKSNVGVCRHTKRIIELSKPFVECNSELVIYNTILHEIAHALLPVSEGHSHKWKRLFIQIGGNGKRVSRVTLPKGKHSYRCPKCNYRYEQYRGQVKGYLCSACSTRKTPVKMELIYDENSGTS